MKALFISKSDLVKNTPISGNLDIDKILHFINVAQDIHVQTILGSRLYERLQNDIIAGTLSGDYETLVEEYIKPMLVQFSFMEFLPFSQYTVGNKGVFKKTSENGENPTTEEIEKMKEATRDIANHYARRLVDKLKYESGRGTYPEYNQVALNTDEMKPQKDITFGGWHI
jgi:hypothetical protein